MLCFSITLIPFLFKFYVFVYFWPHWIFVAVQGLSSVAASGGRLSSCSARATQCSGFLSWRAQALGHVGSEVAAHGLSCPTAYGIFLDQGSNPRPPHWQADRFLTTGPPGKAHHYSFSNWIMGIGPGDHLLLTFSSLEQSRDTHVPRSRETPDRTLQMTSPPALLILSLWVLSH